MSTGFLRRLGVAALAVWFLAPLVPLLLWAAANRWSFPAVLPQQFGADGARTALRAGAVEALAESLALGAAVALLATPAGALAARALVVHRVPGGGAVAALLLAPLALPPFAVAMGLDVVLLRLGVPGYAGVVLLLTVIALPYTTYVMRVGYGAYDVRFEEEARTLGASPAAVVWRVQLPMLVGPLSTAAFLAFLVGWTDYIVTLLVGGGRIVTVPVLVGSYASGIGNEAVVAALSFAALLPPVVLLVLVARLRAWRPAP